MSNLLVSQTDPRGYRSILDALNVPVPDGVLTAEGTRIKTAQARRIAAL